MIFGVEAVAPQRPVGVWREENGGAGLSGHARLLEQLAASEHGHSCCEAGDLTVTRWPLRRSAMAADKPQMPAPTMRTCISGPVCWRSQGPSLDTERREDWPRAQEPGDSLGKGGWDETGRGGTRSRRGHMAGTNMVYMLCG